ncbi:VOC family protein [Streptomyces sp. NPDC053427]|uniref:VOC family protein n=1 Tax=Streptomyces sp. NPDC053427 TaxID=3365701 RepID=UPI0037D6DE25
MSDTVYGLGVDAAGAGAEKFAHFRAEALGREVASGEARIRHTRPGEATSAAIRFHLDLISPTVEAESQRLIALGACQIRHVAQGSARWATLADPEGNEFALVAG